MYTGAHTPAMTLNPQQKGQRICTMIYSQIDIKGPTPCCRGRREGPSNDWAKNRAHSPSYPNERDIFPSFLSSREYGKKV